MTFQKLTVITDNKIHNFIKTSFKKYEEYKKQLKIDRKSFDYLKHPQIPEDYLPFQNFGRYNFREYNDCVPITVGLSHVENVLNLLNILFINLEMNGFKIYISNESDKFSRKMVFEKDKETMTFSLKQGYNWRKITHKNDNDYLRKVPVPNENFTFDILGLMRGGYKSFKMTTKKPLESILELIFNQFLNMPLEQKLKREEKEESERQYEEEYRKKTHNYEILENQNQQYELAINEAEVFKQRLVLKDYLIELNKEVNNLSNREKELAVKWISIVNHHFEVNNPIQKRLNYFSKLLDKEYDNYDSWYKDPIII